jgi:uncharacterized phage-associated protein
VAMDWIEVNELFYEKLESHIPVECKKIEKGLYYIASSIEGIPTRKLINWLYNYPFKEGRSLLEVYKDFMDMPVSQIKSEIVLNRLEK